MFLGIRGGFRFRDNRFGASVFKAVGFLGLYGCLGSVGLGLRGGLLDLSLEFMGVGLLYLSQGFRVCKLGFSCLALGFRGMHTSVKGDVFWRFWLLNLFRRFWVTRTRASTCVNIQAPTQTHMRHIVQIYIYIYVCVCLCGTHTMCSTCTCIPTHIYMCIYIYIYKYT